MVLVLFTVSPSHTSRTYGQTGMSSKSMLLTGCSAGGLGATMALVLVYLEPTSFSNVTVFHLDAVGVSSVIKAAKAVTESGRGLDTLVNNASTGYA